METKTDLQQKIESTKIVQSEPKIILPLKIVTLGNPILRKRAKEVSLSELKKWEFQAFLDKLVETLRVEDGVGIAAPQVNESYRVFAVEVKEDPRYPDAPKVPLQIVINPVIVEYSKEKEEDWEGCLSVPGYRGLVPRHISVKLEGLNRYGNKIKIKAKGFYARIIQHEFDHLNGTVFLDRMMGLSSLMTIEEFSRQKEI